MLRLISIILAVLLNLSGCSVLPDQTDIGTNASLEPSTAVTDPAGQSPDETRPTIWTAQDYASLLAQIDQMTDEWNQQNDRFAKFFGSPMMPGVSGPMAEAADQAMGLGGSSNFSQTNTQVAGVDEADLIKTDGRYLYVLANNRLNILDAREPSRLKLVASIRYLNQNQDTSAMPVETPVELYLDTDRQRLTVLLNGYNPTGKYQSYTLTLVYDVGDPAHPDEVRRFAQEGSYVSSRRIDEHVYIVSQKYAYHILPYPMMAEEAWPGEDAGGIAPEFKAETRPSEPEAIDPLDIFPKISETEASGFQRVAPDQIALVPSGDPANQVILASVDTSRPQQPAQVLAVLGSSGTVYASTGNLYLFGYQMSWTSEGNWTDQSTLIFRYSLDEGQIRADGQGIVPGNALNQFSFDEYKGYLRVATTVGQNWQSSVPSQNNLYILDSDLSIKGSITGLAKNEMIRSVRFIGDRGYVVTFRTTDPLFVLDLTDPSQPTVAGELKIPGYSAYLHPWSKDRLLGFGYDVAVDGDRAFERGLKVSLFDIANPKNPRELSTLLLGSQGSYTELTYNHKVLLADPAASILAFPALLAKTTSGSPLEYGQPYFQGLVVMRVISDRIRLQGGISHIDRSQSPDGPSEPLTGEDQSRFYGYDQVLRGVTIGDILYTFSNHTVQASRISDLSAVGSVDLPGYDEQAGWWGGVAVPEPAVG